LAVKVSVDHPVSIPADSQFETCIAKETFAITVDIAFNRFLDLVAD